MSQEKLVVADDLVVSLAYTLQLDDGQPFERADDQDPLEFIQGHGQIISGLENALYGMRIGDEKTTVVEPANGYGEYDEDELDVMPRSSFPSDLELTAGTALHMRDTESGETFTAHVIEANSDDVHLDFNHPLAGETLHFQVRIVDLRAATAEELAHGHVHGPG